METKTTDITSEGICRIIVAVTIFLLLFLPFVLLYELRDNLHNHRLGNWREADLPKWTLTVLPFAPIAIWSFLTPFFVALGCAMRVPKFHPLPTLAASAVVIFVVIGGTLAAVLPHIASNRLLAHSYPIPPTTTELAINIGMLVASIIWLASSILNRCSRGRAVTPVEGHDTPA